MSQSYNQVAKFGVTFKWRRSLFSDCMADILKTLCSRNSLGPTVVQHP